VGGIGKLVLGVAPGKKNADVSCLVYESHVWFRSKGRANAETIFIAFATLSFHMGQIASFGRQLTDDFYNYYTSYFSLVLQTLEVF